MRIAIYSGIFPTLSETFVINQIVGLIEQGVQVDIITNMLTDDGVMHGAVKKHSLLQHVKCVGFISKESKINLLVKTCINAFCLLFKGQFAYLKDVLLDSCLTKNQKICLIKVLNERGDAIVNYDNIICHFGDNGYYLCKMRELGLLAGPISTVFHGYELSRYVDVSENLPKYKKLFIKGDLMLPISELWKNQLIDWGCDSSKVKVHRMGVDVEDFEMKPIDSSFSTPLKVIQVGRLTEKKAILDSIQAVSQASKHISIEFNIIGSGDLHDAAQALILSLGASKYINLLGPKPQDVVKKYLDVADVFLLPSVRAADGDMEGVPVALMESMAKGLITVSTNHSGIPELIENGTSGFLVDEHDINALVRCLIKIKELTPEQVASIRLAARTICLLKFNNIDLNKALLSVI